MLSERNDWLPPGDSGNLYYCKKTKRLQLRSVRSGGPIAEDFAIASRVVGTSPMTRDTFGNYARWDSSVGHVVAGGSGQGEIPIFAPPPLKDVTDVAMGYDGVLYVAVDGTLILVDQRKRWPDFTLSDADFKPPEGKFKFWRLAAHPGGGVVALDRENHQLGRVLGLPLQTGPVETPNPGILTSCDPNAMPPRIVSRVPLPSMEAYIGLCRGDANQFVVLSWNANAATNTASYVRIWDEDGLLSAPVQLADLRFPDSIAWLGEGKLAVLGTGLNEALVFDLTDALSGRAAAGSASQKVSAAGDTYILADWNVGPFVHGFESTRYYAVGSEMQPLLPLSLNSFAGSGTTDPAKVRTIDSGSTQTAWHRVFVEAVIPPRCVVIVWLAAANKPADLTGPAAEWFPHVLGSVDPATAARLPAQTPCLVWKSIASEVPFAKPMLGEEPAQDRQGLFMALVQRTGKAVRNLRGRFLGVSVQLNGDRRNTPEIAALRVYASRFSYVEHYLPEIYKENTFGPEADANSDSTRRDFFERFVDIFESQLTQIEDRVANAYLVTRPESAPDDSLDWLGGWIGVPPDSYPPDRRRVHLMETSNLCRERGTIAGIRRAMNVATNGLCDRGAVILVEDFRLRHTFATILGANLAIQDDPLLPGYSASSNSFVGDTFFLGDPHRKEFLSLFANDLLTASEEQSVEQFFDRLAYRMTVFIHDNVEAIDSNLVQRIIESEKPAHVAATVRRATQPFMVGLASLVGVNSYLAPEPPRQSVRVGQSQIGRYDLVMHLPSLDPRMENDADAAFAKLIARLKAPGGIPPGQAIPLDGSASSAPLGRSISTWRWNLVPPK